MYKWVINKSEYLSRKDAEYWTESNITEKLKDTIIREFCTKQVLGKVVSVEFINENELTIMFDYNGKNKPEPFLSYNLEDFYISSHKVESVAIGRVEKIN